MSVTLTWDHSIDYPYIQSYKVYYYTTSNIKGLLDLNDRADSCTVAFPPCSVDQGPITIHKDNIQIKLNNLNDNKRYYFVVSAVENRIVEGGDLKIEGVPTSELPQPLLRLNFMKDGTGRGTVRTAMGAPLGSNPEIDCGTGCASDVADYGHGAVVVLAATEDAGYTFMGWLSGCVVGPDGKCTVTMDADKTVRARFIPTPKGDINNDGLVNLADAILILQVMSKRGTLLPESYLADANRDGTLGLADAIYILQKTAGLR